MAFPEKTHNSGIKKRWKEKGVLGRFSTATGIGIARLNLYIAETSTGRAVVSRIENSNTRIGSHSAGVAATKIRTASIMATDSRGYFTSHNISPAKPL
jgi:hypothetical protein